MADGSSKKYSSSSGRSSRPGKDIFYEPSNYSNLARLCSEGAKSQASRVSTMSTSSEWSRRSNSPQSDDNISLRSPSISSNFSAGDQGSARSSFDDVSSMISRFSSISWESSQQSGFRSATSQNSNATRPEPSQVCYAASNSSQLTSGDKQYYKSSNGKKTAGRQNRWHE